MFNTELLRITFDALPFGIILSAENGDVVLINHYGRHSLGYADNTAPSPVKAETFFVNREMPLLTLPGENLIKSETSMVKAGGEHIPVYSTRSELRMEGLVFHLCSFIDITQRLRSIVEFNEQKRALESLMMMLPGMVFRCENDPNWTMIYLNEGCIELTGYRPEEIIQNSVIGYADLIHPDDRVKVWESVQKGVEQTDYYTIEYRIMTRQGRMKWVSERGHGVFDQNKELRFLEGFISDISERKRNESVQQVLFEISKAAYLSTSLDEFYMAVHQHLGNVIDARNFYVAMYDQQTDTISLPYHVDYKDSFKSFPAGKTMTGYVIKTRQPLLATEREIRKLFEQGLIDIVGTPSKVWLGVPMVVSGEVTGVIAVQSYQDEEQYSIKELELLQFIADQVAIFISRKGAEEAGQREEAFLNQLFEGSPEAIIMIDNNHQVIRSNKIFQQMFGYAPEESAGKDIDTLIATPEIFTEARSISQKVSRGEVYEMETKRKHKDGHLIDVSVLVTPIIIQDEIIGGYGIYRDITEKKRAESKLIEAKEKAEESDKLKSAFLSNMSHEIRTPMNAILGFSSLLSDPGINETDRAEFIQIIRDRGNDLLRIIDDIIDVAKIESGQIKIEIRECPVNVLLSNLLLTLNEVRKKQMKENILLKFTPGSQEKDFTILTDGNRLRQILTNLIENALKFTDEGSVEFGYTFREWMNGEPVIEFYVHDTGIGIPQESQSMIFERFRQVDDTHTRRYGGTGLGLTIVKNLVHLLGGEIRVESKEGKGAAFFVVLPLQTGLTRITTRPTPARITESSENQALSGKHLLIVEDEESNYYLLDRILKRAGIKATWAHNGLEAIELCKNATFDMVLMDIRMPVMDGYEATQEIKKIHPSLPVIAQTAYALKGEKEKSLAAGCDAYISKPIDSKELMSILQQYFNPAG